MLNTKNTNIFIINIKNSPLGQKRKALLDLEIDKLKSQGATLKGEIKINFNNLKADNINYFNFNKELFSISSTAKSQYSELSGVDIYYFSAITPSDFPSFPKHLLHSSRTSFCRGRGLRDGEIACFLSHFFLWGLTYAFRLSHGIILEDDISFGSEFIASIDRLRDYDAFIRLICTYTDGHYTTSIDDFVKYIYKGSGAQGYYLSSSVAARFLSGHLRFLLPVDDYLDECGLSGGYSFALQNYCIKANDLNLTGSEINNNTNTSTTNSKSLKTIIKRELFYMAKFLYNLKYRLAHPLKNDKIKKGEQ